MKILFLLIFAWFLSTTTVAAQDPGSNVALHASATASSEQRPASAAVDGDHTSYWQSGSFVGDHWLAIDLGEVYTVDRIVLPLVTGVDSLVVEVQAGERWEQVYAGNPDNPLIGFEPVEIRRIKLHSIEGGQMRVYEVQVYEYDPQPVFTNQSGYDINRHKRFTAPLAPDGTQFVVTRAGESESLYEGSITEHIGDFTDFRPEEDSGPYVIRVSGEEEGVSFPFEVAPHLIERVAYQPAIDFMIDVRCWFGDSSEFNPTEEDAGCPHLGVAWRDSHQFSFEVQSLLHMYFANPAAFSVDRMPVQGAYLGLTDELPEDTPEVIRLIYWAVDIYLRGEANHTLLKQQLAYFVYAWPWISDYIPRSVYEEARDYVFATWGDEEIHRWQWHDVKHSGNLFETYTLLGTGKGELPTGHSIVPNLLMYEVAKREGQEDARAFLTAAHNQTEWLIANLDWHDPLTTKGQRQGEWVTITSFAHFLKNYPERAPAGLQAKIEEWADVVVERSENMWDFRRYSEDRWIIPTIPGFESETGFNEVGNVAGFPAPLLAATQVIEDDEVRSRLREIATAHIDHVFGRNPAGRHFSFDGALDFEGVELGWFQEYQGGAGILQVARGVLDGSPKEPTYPYNPYAGDPGHTEGWVAFNTPWNISLAYLSADGTSITVYNEAFTEEVTSVVPGKTVGIEVRAPLGFDGEREEVARAVVYLGSESHRVELAQVSNSSSAFRGIFEVPEGVHAENIRVAYGYGWHERNKTLTVD